MPVGASAQRTTPFATGRAPRGRDARIRLALPIDRAQVLERLAARSEHERRLAWNDQREAVVAREIVRLDAIVIDNRPVPLAASDASGLLLLQSPLPHPQQGTVGTLLAVGFRAAQVRRLFLGEAAGLALVGAVLGSLLGLGYTRLVLAGLHRRLASS